MMRVLLLDNYDSFTYNLRDYLLQGGADCTVLRNDHATAADWDLSPFDALVLSPGPGRPEHAGVMPELIVRWHDRLPIFGICLGHQALGQFFGARLVHAAEPRHGKTSAVRQTAPHALWNGLPETFDVMRYHSLLLENLDETPLQTLATTQSGEIMALAHPELPLVGVQFHPESVLTGWGKKMVCNFLGML